MVEPTDSQLLERWLVGDARASNALCLRYDRAIRRFFETKVPPADVADLVQRTWLEAMNVFRRRGSDVRSVRTYLYGIARHLFFEYLQEHRKLTFEPEVDSLIAMDPSLSSLLFLKRRIEWLDLAISSLPIELHLLVEARRAGLNGPELAEMFAIPEGTVRSRLSRSMSLLQEMAAPITAVELSL